MKKIILLPLVLLATACASGNRGLASKINCDKMLLDSTTRLAELQQVFQTYQNVSYDVSAKLMPAYKAEVDEFYNRVKSQKKSCWARDKKPVDVDIITLREEIAKIYIVQPQSPPQLQSQPTPVPEPVAFQTASPRAVASPAPKVEERKPQQMPEDEAAPAASEE